MLRIRLFLPAACDGFVSDPILFFLACRQHGEVSGCYQIAMGPVTLLGFRAGRLSASLNPGMSESCGRHHGSCGLAGLPRGWFFHLGTRTCRVNCCAHSPRFCLRLLFRQTLVCCRYQPGAAHDPPGSNGRVGVAGTLKASPFEHPDEQEDWMTRIPSFGARGPCSSDHGAMRSTKPRV